MIKVTRIDGRIMLLNELHIEAINSAPDSIITMTNGKNYAVNESLDELLELINKISKIQEKSNSTKNTISLKKK